MKCKWNGFDMGFSFENNYVASKSFVRLKSGCITDSKTKLNGFEKILRHY